MRLIASSKNWIEGAAVQQLEKTASLPGMRLAVGLPDLHPGKGSPIGAAFAVEGYLYPALVGNDIGCGVGLWRTELSAKKLKREVWADRLRNLDNAWDGDVSSSAFAELSCRDMSTPSARSAAEIILRSYKRSRASRILKARSNSESPAMRFICASTADRAGSAKRSCANTLRSLEPVASRLQPAKLLTILRAMITLGTGRRQIAN